MLCFDERSHLSLSHRCPARTLSASRLAVAVQRPGRGQAAVRSL